MRVAGSGERSGEWVWDRSGERLGRGEGLGSGEGRERGRAMRA